MTTLNLENVCPKCGEVGQSVKNITVSHVVKADKRQHIGKADFHLCKTPHCEIGYFNRNEEVTIHKDDFKRPIWFKDGADPVYACYCLSITEEEVIKAVVETDLTDMKEVMVYLRGSLRSNCHLTNPNGLCCTQPFNDMIKKGLEIKDTLFKYDDLSVDSVQVDKATLREKGCSCGSSCGCSSVENSKSLCTC